MSQQPMSEGKKFIEKVIHQIAYSVSNNINNISNYEPDQLMQLHFIYPQRVEPFYYLARYYRQQKSYALAYYFVLQAEGCLQGQKDILNFYLADEKAINSYYLGKYRESFTLYKSLLDSNAVPEHEYERILLNMSYSVSAQCDWSQEYPTEKIVALTQQKINQDGDITFSITTCKRFSLFEKTVNSFINCCLDCQRIKRWIVVDDNSSDEDRQKMKDKYPFFEFVWKSQNQKGHPQSMNIIREMIDTPFWLHLEDDWQFFEPRNYLAEMIQILEADSRIKQVLFNRNYTEKFDDSIIGLKLAGGINRKTSQGIRYRVHEHYQKDSQEWKNFLDRNGGNIYVMYWPHYSLRPSLIKTEILSELGFYSENSEVNFELDYARRYFEKGYLSAFFDRIFCLHIGRTTIERGGNEKNAYELNHTNYWFQ